MDENQTERLIELIRDRPALYDKRLKQYADRSINRALWKEVCEAIIDSWSSLTAQEKTLKAKEIQQRWQNLRTCFKRELNKSKAGQLSKKRRKYIYYNQLLFLLPTIDAKASAACHRLARRKSFLKRTCTQDDIDEDKSFLLSLVPSFRRMTDDQKLEVKMEFLGVLQRVQRTASAAVNDQTEMEPCTDPVRSPPASGDSWVSPNETASPDLLEIRHFKME